MRVLERARVPAGNKWVVAENVSIGGPVLHPNEEWRARTKREWDAKVLSLWLIVLPLSFVMFVPRGLLGDGMDLTLGLLLAFIMGVILPAVVTIGYRLSWNRIVEGGVFSGLYENGIVAFYPATSTPQFVPYGTIEEVKLRGMKPFQRIPVIQVRGLKHPTVLPIITLLGDDGWDWVRYRISHPPGPVAGGPPELHVYGDRGAMVTSVPGIVGKGNGPG